MDEIVDYFTCKLWDGAEKYGMAEEDFWVAWLCTRDKYNTLLHDKGIEEESLCRYLYGVHTSYRIKISLNQNLYAI